MIPFQTEMFMRLAAHWPSLGGPDDDMAARARARDWQRMIARYSPEVAWMATDTLIQGWTANTIPRPGNWAAVAHQAAHRMVDPPKALEMGPPDEAEQARVHELIENARRHLARPVSTEGTL